MNEGFQSLLSKCSENLKSLFGSFFSNRTLLVTIHKAIFPITHEVLHQVFSPYGSVKKIVSFQKSVGVQFLIQYQGYGTIVASRSLQSRNIYDDCCQFDIQFWDDSGVTDFELETWLEDSGDLEEFDKMTVRKIKVQNVGVKDGEAIILESSRVSLAGATSSGSDDQIEGLTAPVKDESIGISVSLQETEEVTKALHSLSVTLPLVVKASTVVDEESREKNQLIDRNNPIDIRNCLMPSIEHG
ncbi:hypothetical protein GQ457_06G019450 [Hibiscus cannabinus]